MNGLGNQNKWKYSTIALLAVVAVGLSFPQASAAASATLNDIYKKLTGVETNVNTIKTNTDTIKADVTDMKEDVDALPSLIESTRATISFDETLNENQEFIVFRDTFPMGGILSVDVTTKEPGGLVGLLCDGGGIHLSDGHHEIPRFCADNLKFGLGVSDPNADPSVEIKGSFIVTNVEPLEP